ncbi:hypothetical protein HETIRDRAFT_437555 [Heterobasidion irregulare TC 32-1]|uniref:EF-hand domain-containing protein n=1 Tax=Heterobasidion irregulare (strain TC 32-1) TaxID=747525 RepID=W4KLS2_HETIT|nr:uncharacterized protein HETIRDRAFT_437555 [Heterobasidion irregulare TC 32-1]ETW86773.1 hypothetical protein HETIRDRAFT_437555 [Heterobasidion irregulare TC 32-1]
MATEHHIDSFDLASFFQLHDLNRDGVWDTAEIEAIYGVHHVYSQKKSKDDVEHQKKADTIVQAILKAMDKDGNEKVTQKEFEAVGLAGLPSFDELGAEGHHYDVESEFFLHHEEQYHSTPETQTDESYTHPEDLEHFAQHEAIEHKEAEREAKFQGITVEEALLQHEEHEHDEAPPALVADSNDADNDTTDAAHPPTTKKIQRQTPPEKQDPAVRFRDAKAESERHGDWGSGDAGYKPPNTPSEKMRKNLPYKYKFRRSWGDF